MSCISCEGSGVILLTTIMTITPTYESPPEYVPPPEPPQQQPWFNNDQYFLALVSQIPGVTVIDPVAMTTSGRKICNEMLYDGISPENQANSTVRNTPGATLAQARAMVSAAITAYCPHYRGG